MKSNREGRFTARAPKREGMWRLHGCMRRVYKHRHQVVHVDVGKVTKGVLLLSLMYRGNGLLDLGLICTVTFLYKLACVLIIVKERK